MKQPWQRTWVWLVVWLVALSTAAPLLAQEMSPTWRRMAGHPLTLYVTQDGRYELYPAPDTNASPLRGSLYLQYETCVIVPAPLHERVQAEAMWLPVSQSPLHGRGMIIDPWRVLTEVQGVCTTEAGEPESITVQTVASYVDGESFFHLTLNVCGGRAGLPLTLGLLTEGGNAPTSQLAAESTVVLDAQGCATFRILWDYAAPPQTPLVLQMATTTAVPGRDAIATWGVPLVFFGFALLTGAWLWVMRPKKR